MTVLRNGRDVPQAAVVPVMLALEKLADTNPVALYELFGNSAGVLAGIGLLEPDGRFQGVTRDVVLAAAEGDGSDLHLRSPYTPEGTP